MGFPIFDGHCDTVMGLMRGKSLLQNDMHVSLERAAQLDGYVQTFALFTAFASRMELTQSELMSRLLHSLMQQLGEHSDRISLCLTPADIRRTLAEGKAGAVLSIEGAESLNCDPGLLEDAYHLGVRMIGLTWNADNALCGWHGSDQGLTLRGREFVRRAQEMGIIIDVSHASDNAIFDICDMAIAPVIASHSNARAICGHSRNLSDDAFRALCSTGGTAGLNLYAEFLNDNIEACTIDDCVRHIEHFWDLGGENHVALGGDLDGCRELPQGVSGVDGYRLLIDALQGRGVKDALITKLCFDNLMGVFEKLCSM